MTPGSECAIITHRQQKGVAMSKIWKLYEKCVQKYEAEGMTRSDAQGVVDAEFLQKHGPGWEFR